ncbi:MAG: ABC-2 transporter permease [Clostridia bacterium]|nr:ABC-2 transporter permease [Clostridia bacterium]
MKGLLLKDLCLLKSQKRILPVYLMLSVWFTVMHNDGFGVPFLMMMASIQMISTISYD